MGVIATFVSDLETMFGCDDAVVRKIERDIAPVSSVGV